ncbi:uncharacterized protein TrAtP1_012541 [Trichoderma atroviride]|uniref:uncharacterized protein n=1 Tax=Hypocrea atroviridis TaxID=63577 RepID=UPI00332B2B59|nr:hypothetical protein TrAtP1_012541 [Trichoderma atroviride]
MTAELKARGVSGSDEIAARRRDCLDRIMLSRVFDMDGLDEVLADLDATAAAAAPRGGKEEEETIEIQSAEEIAVMGAQPNPTPANVDGDCNGAVLSKEETPGEASVVAEIQDSQDEDETPSPPSSPISKPQPPHPQPNTNLKDTTATTEPDNHSLPNRQVDNKNNGKSTTTTASSTPDIVLITHFSSLLTSFFTQRDKSAAHVALRLLATRLRHLSRTLPSNPLILLLNSTDSGAHASESHSHENNLNMNSIPLPLPDQQSSSTAYKSASSSTDPTLRSIFNPAHHASTSYKANKPTFGLVFTQLLDLHLLCTRAPRHSRAATSSLRAVTVVEVLLDELGLWEGERGQRKRREQRWTIMASRNGRMVSVPGSGRKKKPRVMIRELLWMIHLHHSRFIRLFSSLSLVSLLSL